MPELTAPERMALVVQIASSYVGHNQLSPDQLPRLIASVAGTLSGLGKPAPEAEPAKQEPAVSPRRSITPEYLICLEDGKKLKMLKRYLRTTYDMSPEQYRAKWNLAPDYPMVAPNYAARRSEFAKKIGLGRKRVAPVEAAPPPPPTKTRRPRRKTAA